MAPRLHGRRWFAGSVERPPIACSPVTAVEAGRRCGITRRSPRRIQLVSAMRTIWRVLKRHGVSRRARAPRPPANRYEYAAPGELVHVDIKQLGRFWQVGKRALDAGVSRNSRAGRPSLHLAGADHSRYAAAQLRPTQTGKDAAAFLEHALERFAEHGIQVQRVMSDNGACYRSNDHRDVINRHGLRHLRTRPYTPRTNGKAE